MLRSAALYWSVIQEGDSAALVLVRVLVPKLKVEPGRGGVHETHELAHKAR